MYSRILVPVDLGHAERLDKALKTAAKIASGDGATVIYTGVTTTEPGPVAHTPEEFARKLEAFAGEQARAHGLSTEAHPIRAHDVPVELGDRLVEAARATGADLVVMASHVPGVADHMFASNASKVAAHAPMSVFVVR